MKWHETESTCAFYSEALVTIYEQNDVTTFIFKAVNLIPNGYYDEACQPHQAVVQQ